MKPFLLQLSKYMRGLPNQRGRRGLDAQGSTNAPWSAKRKGALGACMRNRTSRSNCGCLLRPIVLMQFGLLYTTSLQHLMLSFRATSPSCDAFAASRSGPGPLKFLREARVTARNRKVYDPRLRPKGHKAPSTSDRTWPNSPATERVPVPVIPAAERCGYM